MLIYPTKVNITALVEPPSDSTNRIDDVRRDCDRLDSSRKQGPGRGGFANCKSLEFDLLRYS